MNVARQRKYHCLPATMSFFSTALDRLLPEHDLSPADLARKADVPANYISRYRSGIRADPEALEKIAGAFGKDGPELVVAWLRDAVPESFLSQIQVNVAKGSREQPPNPWDQLSPRERRLFEELAKRCHENPKVRPLLEQVLEFSRPG